MKKISLIISLTGILILLFLLNNQKIPEFKISEINKNNLDKQVSISGKVISQKNYENFSILILEDQTGKIQVTCNCKINNTEIKVIGRVTEYQNNLQVSADKIIQTNNLLNKKTH